MSIIEAGAALVAPQKNRAAAARYKAAPTLVDALIRRTVIDKKDARIGAASAALCRTLLSARKFYLDEGMSGMLADLAYASLGAHRSAARDNAVLDGMRALSRLPHAVTWIEYDMIARKRRAVDEYGAHFIDDGVSPERGGWLVEQHPQTETAFRVTECLSHSLIGGALVEDPMSNWLSWTWRSDDGPSPWGRRLVEGDVAAVLTGIGSYNHASVSVVEGPYPLGVLRLTPDVVRENVMQNASDLRYLWALLATINDLPTVLESVRPSRGYLARGRYRKFVEHTVVRLTVPATRHRALARRATAASRRRAHQVRGHWRKLQTGPGGLPHRVWIHEHQRGDAGLGFVTHDYAVARD